jgi:hypothetical protein
VPEGAALIDRLLAEEVRPLLFYDIDTPVTLAALDRGEVRHLRPDQIPRSTPTCRSRAVRCSTISNGSAARGGPRCSTARSIPTGIPTPPAAWPAGISAISAPIPTTASRAGAAAPRTRAAVARPALRGGGADVSRQHRLARERGADRAPAPSRHAAFYNAQRFTLNVTRADMRRMGWSPSVRLFEAAACGTPILSDPWPGLTDLFPEGEAILIGRSSDEVVDILTSLPEDRRQSIGQSARARVLRWHSGRARARHLARLVEELASESVEG